MELLSGIALGIAGILAVVAINVLSNDLYDRCSKIAAWIIARAVDRLPLSKKQRYREEWLAHAAECNGNIAKIIHGVECFICARALGRVRSRLVELSFGRVTVDRGTGAEKQLNAQQKVALDGPTYLFFLETMDRIEPLPPELDQRRSELRKEFDGIAPDLAMLQKLRDIIGDIIPDPGTCD